MTGDPKSFLSPTPETAEADIATVVAGTRAELARRLAAEEAAPVEGRTGSAQQAAAESAPQRSVGEMSPEEWIEASKWLSPLEVRLGEWLRVPENIKISDILQDPSQKTSEALSLSPENLAALRANLHIEDVGQCLDGHLEDIRRYRGLVAANGAVHFSEPEREAFLAAHGTEVPTIVRYVRGFKDLVQVYGGDENKATAENERGTLLLLLWDVMSKRLPAAAAEAPSALPEVLEVDAASTAVSLQEEVKSLTLEQRAEAMARLGVSIADLDLLEKIEPLSKIPSLLGNVVARIEQADILKFPEEAAIWARLQEYAQSARKASWDREKAPQMDVSIQDGEMVFEKPKITANFVAKAFAKAKFETLGPELPGKVREYLNATYGKEKPIERLAIADNGELQILYPAEKLPWQDPNSPEVQGMRSDAIALRDKLQERLVVLEKEAPVVSAVPPPERRVEVVPFEKRLASIIGLIGTDPVAARREIREILEDPNYDLPDEDLDGLTAAVTVLAKIK